MTNIIVVLPRLEDARSIRNILVRNGIRVTGVCATGAQAVSQADSLHDGIVICSYKMPDMIYSELHEYLPAGFEMLLMASPHLLSECCERDIVCLSMPLKVDDLIGTVHMMSDEIERRRRRDRQKPRVRSAVEEAAIREAKELLMAEKHMTEEEAHRYLQKSSMDSGTGLAETAQMVLSVMKAKGTGASET